MMIGNDSGNFRMKWLISFAAITVLVLMVAWMAGAFDEKVAPGREDAAQRQLRASSDSVFEVKQQDIEVLEAVPATIAAKQTAMISSRILARIEKVKVRAGDYVKKGQVLIILEHGDLTSRVSQAQAQIASAEARMTEARQALERAVELNRRGLLAQAPLEAAQANFASQQAQLDSARNALLEAKTLLDYASVVAPFDGLVVDRFAEPGNTAQPGMALLSLYNPSSVRVEANVREERALQLELGQKLKMDIPSKSQERIAEVEELVPAGNVASRTFMIKSRINDADGLLPGMYARLMIPAGVEQRILIPQDYVAQVGQLNLVWVLHESADNVQIEKRFIKTGLTHKEGMVEVVSGLSAGERLLKKP